MAGHGPSLWPPWCPHHLSAHDGHYPPRRYTATYPDYIVIHWEEHLLCLGCATGFRAGWAHNQPQSVTSDNQGPEPGKSHRLEPTWASGKEICHCVGSPSSNNHFTQEPETSRMSHPPPASALPVAESTEWVLNLSPHTSLIQVTEGLSDNYTERSNCSSERLLASFNHFPVSILKYWNRMSEFCLFHISILLMIKCSIVNYFPAQFNVQLLPYL